jgi:hypothetical protein
MNLSRGDLAVTMTMSIAVIFMSFTFPALGLTGDSVNESEIPEFNISKGTVEFARDSPEYPSRPSEGTLTYINGSEAWEDERQVYLQRGSTEYLLSFFDDNPDPGPKNVTWHANLIKFNSSGSYTNDVDINESESKTLTSVDGAYEVGLSNLDVVNNTSANQTAQLDWEVLEQPSDQSWLGRIPVVGTIISGASQLAAVVGWIGGILWHLTTQILVAIGNAILMFVNVTVYFIDFSWWLTSTYTGIVSGAPTAWAGVIVAIPGIILGFQFSKIMAVGIKLLPFT